MIKNFATKMQQGARPSLLAILPSSFKDICMMLAESLLGVFWRPFSFHGQHPWSFLYMFTVDVLASHANRRGLTCEGPTSGVGTTGTMAGKLDMLPSLLWLVSSPLPWRLKAC